MRCWLLFSELSGHGVRFRYAFCALDGKEAVSTYCQLDDSIDLDDVKSLMEKQAARVSFDESWPKGKS